MTGEIPQLGEGVLLVDLDAPMPALRETGPFGTLCLVRRAGVPVCVLEVTPDQAPLSSDELARRIRDRLACAISDHSHVASRTASSTTASSRTSVVVATRNRSEELAVCLASMRAMARSPARTIVVDNAPSDARTERLVRRLQTEDPTLVYVMEPMPGLASAHNAALPHVDTPLVAFTDDDVIVDPLWLERIEEAFASAADVACVTGLIFPVELVTREQWWVEAKSGFAKGLTRRIFDMGPNRPRGDPLFPYAAGTFGSGANMAFTRAFLAAVDGFDPALGAGSGSLGGDDLATLHEVLASGHQLVYEPSAIVFHRHPCDMVDLRRQALGYGAGLTAYLTRVVIERPAVIPAIARRTMAAGRHAFGRHGALTGRRPSDYPRELVIRERLGMLTGPWRYLQARRRRRDQPTPSPVARPAVLAANG